MMQHIDEALISVNLECARQYFLDYHISLLCSIKQSILLQSFATHSNSHSYPTNGLLYCSVHSEASLFLSSARFPSELADRFQCSCDRRSCFRCLQCTQQTHRHLPSRSEQLPAYRGPRYSSRREESDPCNTCSRSFHPSDRNRN